MKILVCGGAGYIGSHTILEMHEQYNWEPISIDNHSNSTPEAYQRIQNITNKSVEQYNLDLNDFDALDQLLSNLKIDGIIHFAALKAVGESVDHPDVYYRNNINSLLNILDVAKKHKIKNFIFSSSCSVYGNIKSLPVSEMTTLGNTESPYARTKLFGEEIIKDYAKQNTDFRYICLR
ncbi:MAG: GDP-mannose 4,6-dehydratase, partial [Flavobacteriales bacterium]|nr:GDP-mannose 4,6-dehydratase [Flavobacteriales bacterium]